MNNLLKSFYEAIEQEEPAIVQADKRINEEVKALTAPYKEKYGPKEAESIRDDMFGIASLAQQEGFQAGIVVLAKLILEVAEDL